MNEYENTRRIIYGKDRATFVPVCEKCGQYVRPDEFVMINDMVGLKDEPNATCSRCERTKMIFEGFF